MARCTTGWITKWFSLAGAEGRMMKVKCIKLFDAKGNPQEWSPWLTLGKVYHVLEVIQDPRRKWLLRVLGNGSDGVGIFRLEQFEIVSTKVPDAWIVDLNTDGDLTLTTEDWNKPGFWDAYYDRDPNARKKFEDGKRKIVDGDP